MDIGLEQKSNFIFLRALFRKSHHLFINVCLKIWIVYLFLTCRGNFLLPAKSLVMNGIKYENYQKIYITIL